jgi:hypothetical protein
MTNFYNVSKFFLNYFLILNCCEYCTDCKNTQKFQNKCLTFFIDIKSSLFPFDFLLSSLGKMRKKLFYQFRFLSLYSQYFRSFDFLKNTTFSALSDLIKFPFLHLVTKQIQSMLVLFK